MMSIVHACMCVLGILMEIENYNNFCGKLIILYLSLAVVKGACILKFGLPMAFILIFCFVSLLLLVEY